MPLLSNLYVVGAGKQAAEGTLLANPQFSHGVTGDGAIHNTPKHSLPDISGLAGQAIVDRERVDNGASFESRAYLKALGLYLLGLFGSDVVTGTGPYVHTYAIGNPLPFLSFSDKFAVEGFLRAVRDCRVTSFKISWEENRPAIISVEAPGTVFSIPATFVPVNDENGSSSFLIPTGGSFQLAGVGSVLGSARIKKFEVEIKNNVDEDIYASGSLERATTCRGTMSGTCKATVVPDDRNLWLAALTGATNGTGVCANAPLGSFAATLKENLGGTGQLVMTATNTVAFVSAYPKASGKGGAAELELDGDLIFPAGATPIVFALTNSVASY